MTIDSIERKISTKCKYLQDDFYKTNKGIAVKVLGDYPQYNDLLYFNMDIKSLLYLMLIENNNYSRSYDKIIDFFSNNCDFKAFAFICELYKDGNLSYLLEFRNDSDKTKSLFYKKVQSATSDFNLDFFKYVVENIEDVLKLFDNIDSRLLNDISHIRLYYEELNNAEDIRPSYKKDKAFMRRYICSKYNPDYAIAKTKELYELAIQKASHVTVKSIDSKVRSYRKVLSLLKSELNKDEIVETINSAERIDDDGIKDAILTFIFEHNKNYWEKLEKDYIEKNSNSINSFIAFFNALSLDFKSLPDSLKKKIMEDSLDKVKEKVAIIRKFADNKQLFIILANISIDNLLLINYYLTKQYVTSDFISNNITSLLNTDVFDNFKGNVELLESEINFRKYSDLSFLLADNSIVRSNINLLNKYGIPFKNAKDISFIKLPIVSKLCSFIEVGLESVIMSKPDILNADIDLAKRVLLTKEIGEDIFTNGELDSLIIYKSRFFANEKEVNEFALTRDNSEYNGNGELYLSNMDSTQLSYIIDGVVVPKMRVREQPISLDDIIRPSLYSKEQIQTLEKSSIK